MQSQSIKDLLQDLIPNYTQEDFEIASDFVFKGNKKRAGVLLKKVMDPVDRSILGHALLGMRDIFLTEDVRDPAGLDDFLTYKNLRIQGFVYQLENKN